MWQTYFFWFCMALEALILIWVSAYAFLYVVPWEKMRARREATAELREVLPPLLARAKAAVVTAGASSVQTRVASIRETDTRMTADAMRLAQLCLTLLESIGRDYYSWPVEALQVCGTVAETLDGVEQICALRDAKLPGLALRLIENAETRLTAIERQLQEVRLHVQAVAASGLPLRIELRMLDLLEAGIAASRPLADTEPESISVLADDWLRRLTDVAESVALREALRKRVAEIRAGFAARAERVQQLQLAVRPTLVAKLATLQHAGLKERLSSLAYAEVGVQRAEEELQRAEAAVQEEGVDVGLKASSAKRMIAALRAAELANALLSSFEDDLTLLIATLGARGSTEDVN